MKWCWIWTQLSANNDDGDDDFFFKIQCYWDPIDDKDDDDVDDRMLMVV